MGHYSLLSLASFRHFASCFRAARPAAPACCSFSHPSRSTSRSASGCALLSRLLLAPIAHRAPSSSRSYPLHSLDRAEVEKHNTRDSIWVTYDQCVYDVTEFVENHPGGVRRREEERRSEEATKPARCMLYLCTRCASC
jgi:hypothetical protein